MKDNGNEKVTQTYNPNSHKISSSASSERVICMKGSIFPQKDRGRWAVGWHCSLAKRSYVITRYNDHFMHITCYKTASNGNPILDKKGFPIPDKDKCQGYRIAGKLLAKIQRTMGTTPSRYLPIQY
jgi:hypothetical protein